MLRNSHLRCFFIITIFCCLVWITSFASADTTGPNVESLMPDPDIIIKRILGVDEMAKNVCLIDSHQMVNAADLPGRLVSISPDRQVPSDLLRYCFRKPGAKIITQVNPPAAPIHVTRLEAGQVKNGSLLNWFGATMSKEYIAELRTIALPATSISVDDLDEESISERFSTVPEDTRKGLGIITDVIPYEVLASVCRKTSDSKEAGIWYIRLGKNIYSKQSEELRRYYLVAVYTPIVFYDDIGVISNVKSSMFEPEIWEPGSQIRNRAEAFKLWLKEQTRILKPAKFSVERKVELGDVPMDTRKSPKNP